MVNQKIALDSAEKKFLNAAIARENAENAFVAYLKIDPERLETELNAISKDRDDDDPTRKALRRDVVKARAVRRGARVFWKYDRMILKRLNWERANSWRFWRKFRFDFSDVSESIWKLSDKEEAELDQRLRQFGYAVRD